MNFSPVFHPLIMMSFITTFSPLDISPGMLQTGNQSTDKIYSDEFFEQETCIYIYFIIVNPILNKLIQTTVIKICFIEVQ